MTVHRSPLPDLPPRGLPFVRDNDFCVEPTPPYEATVLKDELNTRIERIQCSDGRSLVRKVYRNRQFLLWRTFLLRSRAAREFHNLHAIYSAGVPCIRPVAWHETRMYGFVPKSELLTEFVAGTSNLKEVLRQATQHRPFLMVGVGQLLRRLHDAGIASFRFSTRNVMVQGEPPQARLLLCDQPYAIHFGHSIACTPVAEIDLFDIGFSAQRCRELSRTERWRLLLAYTKHDRDETRRLWRRLSRRTKYSHRCAREMWSSWRNYVRPFLAFFSRGRAKVATMAAPIYPLETASRPVDHDPLAPGKSANYDSQRGALAYKQDHADKLHRRYSTRLEKAIFARLFRDHAPCGTLLDLPSGNGRLFPLLREHAARVIEADWSGTMLSLNRADHAAGAHGYVRCSTLEIPLQDRSVDVAVSVRLSHHLERQIDRENHLRELFRVARDRVVVTYFSHNSLKSVLRRIRSQFGSKRRKNTLRTQRVVEIANECGFELLDAIPLSRLGSGHVFAHFARRR